MFLRPWLDGFRFAKDEDAAAVADAPEADDAVDEKVEEAGDGADDGGAEAGDQVEAQQAESADPTDDDGDDDASPAQAATFDHGIEGVPTSAEEFRSWHATQQAEQARARQQGELAQQQLMYLLQQQQQAAAAQQAPVKQPEAWKAPWEIPQWDQSLESQLTLDENGNVITKPGAIPTLAGDYQKYQAAFKKANSEFVRDPASVFKSYLEHAGYLTKEQVEQQVKAAVERVEEQSFLERETERNREWALDANGQPTPAAQTWNQYYAMLRQHGVPYRQAVAMSHKALGGDAFDASLSQQQTAAQQKAADKERQQTKVERNREVLRAANAPNRSGAQERRTRKVPSKFPGVRKSLERSFAALDKSDFPLFN